MMRRRFALAVATIAWQAACFPAGANAQAGGIPCDAFAKNADGSWTVLATTYVEGPNVRVRENAVLQPGFLIRGYDIAAIIAKACPNAAVASPPDVPAAVASPPGAPAATEQPPQQSRSPLATYADANGNIDVGRLSCGHLDAVPSDQAELLLAWYSGWYNGLAKGQGINLARLRYNIRGVIDYCKAHRDERLTDAMRSLLK